MLQLPYKCTTIDIETDGLDATKIWVVVCQDINTKKIRIFQDNTNLKRYLVQYEKIIGHNVLSFDVPILNELWTMDISMEKVVDTLIISQLFSPNREKGHSLAAWGHRLGMEKGEFNDFSSLSREMVDYCIQDAKITTRVYEYLMTKEKKDFSDTSIILEHKIRDVINKQQKHGFYLDVKKAHMLMVETKSKAKEIEEEILVSMQAKVKFVKHVVPKIKKNGEISSVGIKQIPNYETVVEGEFSSIEFQPFNLASPQQIIERMQEYGWKPIEFTPKGNPKVSERNLSTVSPNAPKALQKLAEWKMLETRWKTVEAWLEAVDTDSRVHGKVRTMGAITGRMTHSEPNMANVVASYKPYGKECRDCWTVADTNNYALVGVDAKGLELRMLAHYMNDKEFTDAVVSGDPHTLNQKAAGLPTREAAKTFIYALCYGAGSQKIGNIIGGSSREGEKLKQKFFKNMPKLGNLIKKAQLYSRRGYVRGVDGRRLLVRSSHASLNTLLQGAGAICCKQWSILLDDKIEQLQLDAHLVNTIHDEQQYECHKKDVDKLCEIADTTMQQVGVDFNMNIILNADAKVGTTWAETH
jgi:DNA polymerase-1|tara:strand:- start:322 stop:2070 length:1749 start_codon:yes stop_codon:yes gene_type:complete